MFEFRRPYQRSQFDPLGWNELFRGFDRLFRELDRELPLTSFGHAASALSDENDKFVLRVDVPGLTEKDVKVDVKDGAVTVSAERPVEAPEGYTARRRERPGVQFSRSFLLGDQIDPEKTSAEIKDGILTVNIGKSQAVQKRSIPVKAH
jgi:HSP20 family molecular chaperone IbpA